MLQRTDWGMWASWMAAGAKVGVAPGYTVKGLKFRCKPGGMGSGVPERGEVLQEGLRPTRDHQFREHEHADSPYDRPGRGLRGVLFAAGTGAEAQCVNKAGQGTGSNAENAKFQAWEAVLQATDWGSWASFMSANGKVGSAPGYKV